MTVRVFGCVFSVYLLFGQKTCIFVYLKCQPVYVPSRGCRRETQKRVHAVRSCLAPSLHGGHSPIDGVVALRGADHPDGSTHTKPLEPIHFTQLLHLRLECRRVPCGRPLWALAVEHGERAKGRLDKAGELQRRDGLEGDSEQLLGQERGALNLQVDLERIVRAPLKGSDHALLQAVALGLCHDVRCPLARPVFNDVCDRAIGFGDPVRRKGDRMRSVRTLP